MGPEQQPQPKPRIDPKVATPMALVLMGIAVLSDLFNWIPVVNIVLAVLTAGFPLYFWFKGLPYSVSLIGDLAEMIPGLSVIPALSVSVGLTLYADHNPDSSIGKWFTQLTNKFKGAKTGVTTAVSAKASGIPRIKTPKGALGELA